MLKNRRSKLAPFLESQRLDALLITNLLNCRYLCGFTGSEGVLLLTREQGWFLCDSRYTTQAASETSGVEVREFSDKKEALAKLIREQGLGRIGFEAAHLTVAGFNDLNTALAGYELVPVGQELDTIRNVKDAEEIALLAEVAAVASRAVQAIMPMLKPGVSEADVARELEFEMRRAGADGRAFDFIVASGERGALPHGRASSRLLRSGELVTIDYGAALNGYHSDETITVAIGSPDPKAAEIHAVVKEAHDRAMAAVRPGVSTKELDSLARDYIKEKGYGAYFGHGLGHGVGLEIHEKPVLSPRQDVTVEEGMVFTVEPGIYIPGFGGVRIEDTVAVTADGYRLLTQAPKELLVFG